MELITYEEIQQFLSNNSDLSRLANLIEKNPLYGIFLTLQKLNLKLINSKQTHDLSFSEAEVYLENYLAGNLTKEAATELFNALMTRKENYLKLIHKIDENTLALQALKDIDISHSITNQQIKEKIKTAANGARRKVFYQRLTYSLLTGAAAVLLFFLLRFQITENIEQAYNFDDTIPLAYNNSALRNSSRDQSKQNPDFARIDFKFTQGISEYLICNYAAALKEWEGLEQKFLDLENKSAFDVEFMNQFYLYKALSLIAIAISKKSNLNETEKSALLNKSLAQFEKMNLNSSSEKYFYALNLALTHNYEQSLRILSTIEKTSLFYQKKLALEERIKELD